MKLEQISVRKADKFKDLIKCVICNRTFDKNSRNYNDKVKTCSKKCSLTYRTISKPIINKNYSPRKKQLRARERILKLIYASDEGRSQKELSEVLNMAYKTIQINTAFLEGRGLIKVKYYSSARVCYPIKTRYNIQGKSTKLNLEETERVKSRSPNKSNIGNLKPICPDLLKK